MDVHLPNGLVRQYSVVQAGTGSYRVGIKREPASRGGSAFMAESLRIGKHRCDSAPRATTFHSPLQPAASC